MSQDAVFDCQHFVCKNCGKKFAVYAYMQWGYRYGRFYACSYSCMRALRAADMEPRPENRKDDKRCLPRGLRKPMTQAEKDTIFRLHGEGYSMSAISRMTGRALATVEYHLKRRAQ